MRLGVPSPRDIAHISTYCISQPPADATLRTVHLLTEEQYVEFQEQLNLIVILLPIVLALMVTIMSRMKWRDKWSVCIMAADTLASEIYKFRLSTCECKRSPRDLAGRSVLLAMYLLALNRAVDDR